MTRTRRQPRPSSPASAARRAARAAARFHLNAGWFDLWHNHFDWDGHGNRSSTLRQQFLHTLYKAFDRALLQAQRRRNIQVFLSICRSDSSKDALYVHTPNPNKRNYPYRFPGCRRMQRVPSLLKTLTGAERFEFLHSRFAGATWYVVRPCSSPKLHETGKSLSRLSRSYRSKRTT